MRVPALLRRIGVLAGGSVLGNILVLAGLPLLSRLYSPESFGALAVFLGLSGILGAILCLRYEQAVYLPDRAETVDQLVLGASFVAFFLMCGATLLLYALGDWGYPDTLGNLVLLVPLAAFGLALYNLLSNWAVREHLIRQVFVTRVSRSATQVGAQLLLGAALWSGPGLIAGELIGRFAGLSLLGRSLFTRIAARGMPGMAAVLEVLRRYRRFPQVAAPAALINVAVMQSPALLLAMLYSPTVAGFYFMAQRLIAAPMAMLGQSVAQAYTAELAKRLNEGVPGAPRLFYRAAGWLALVGGAPLLLLGLASPVVLPWLLGAGWEEAGYYVLILTPFFIAQFVISPLANTLHVLGQQGWFFWWDFGRLLGVVPMLVVPAWMGLAVETALLLFGIFMVLMYVAMFYLIRVALRRA